MTQVSSTQRPATPAKPAKPTSSFSLAAFKERKAPTVKDLAVMCRQMATMVSAGLTVLKTIRILAVQTENHKLALILEQVAVDVESGYSLSVALAKYPETMPPLLIGLVAAGESGGFLDQALENIAGTLERDNELRATVKSALTYPIAVLIMAILAVIAMLIWVVPVFKTMFDRMHGQLPLPTQILVWLSPIAAWGTPFLFIGVIFFMRWWRKNGRQPKIRKVVDPLKLKIPVIGPLLRKLLMARFTRNLASLVEAGVPMLQAFNLVGETADNWLMSDALGRIQASVRLGSSVSAPMNSEQIFPPMVTRMIAVGEESGSLSNMLAKIADFYDAEVKATTDQLTALIEPLMVAVVGLIVGGMVISLYLPMFTIYNSIH